MLVITTSFFFESTAGTLPFGAGFFATAAAALTWRAEASDLASPMSAAVYQAGTRVSVTVAPYAILGAYASNGVTPWANSFESGLQRQAIAGTAQLALRDSIISATAVGQHCSQSQS